MNAECGRGIGIFGRKGGAYDSMIAELEQVHLSSVAGERGMV